MIVVLCGSSSEINASRELWFTQVAQLLLWHGHLPTNLPSDGGRWGVELRPPRLLHEPQLSSAQSLAFDVVYSYMCSPPVGLFGPGLAWHSFLFLICSLLSDHGSTQPYTLQLNSAAFQSSLITAALFWHSWFIILPIPTLCQLLKPRQLHCSLFNLHSSFKPHICTWLCYNMRVSISS